MKNKKMKLSMSLSVLIIGFLISTSSLNNLCTKALLEEKRNYYKIDSFDRPAWNWIMTEVISTESTFNSHQPSLAGDAFGNIHVAWLDVTDYAGAGTDLDIFYKRWNDSIYSWSTTEVVSAESTGESRLPSLAVDTLGNVHVAWQDLTNYAGAGTDWDIFYKRWDASSSTWSTTEVVSTESIGPSYHPSLAVDSTGNVHITWGDDTDYAGADQDIFYKSWDDSISSWTITDVVSVESTAYSHDSSIAVDTLGNVHVAWQDLTNYAGAGIDNDIFYKHWDASSSTWSMTEVVSTESGGHSYYPSLAVDSTGNVHITWGDDTDYAGAGTDRDIFYKSWDDSISSWTITEVVSTESTAYSHDSSIAVDSAKNVHIAWVDGTNYAGAGTDYDIFYKSWDNSISLWTTTEVVSTESTDESRLPSLAVDASGYIHVAWEDLTDYAGAGTDYDIFHKFLIGPPTPPELAFIVPNPTDIDTIYLDWKYVIGATSYYVYRSTSYIWSIDDLVPITSVFLTEYIDTVPSEGYYYYVIVAGNFEGNSSHSNCQYVEVKFADLDAPELAPILPNPIDSSSISLVWASIDGAIEYHIYRSDSYIWSVESLTPIATVGITSYVDTLPSEGHYFYVIVANDGVRNSSHSNCEYVDYKVPHLREFTIVSGLILAAFVLVFVVTRMRKRNFKQN